MEPFESARLKIERARRHLSELTSTLEAWQETLPLTISNIEQFKRGPDKDGQVELGFRYDWHCELVPREVGGILGDFIHNLRTSLDLLANDLVQRAGHDPKDVYFPFAKGAGELDAMIKRRRFHLAGSTAVALLKSFRPYLGGNEELRAIHDLDILDKHRALIPDPPRSFSMAVIHEDEIPGSEMKDYRLRIEHKQRVLLLFPLDMPLAGRPFTPTLEQLLHLVESVVEAFANLPMDKP